MQKKPKPKPMRWTWGANTRGFGACWAVYNDLGEIVATTELVMVAERIVVAVNEYGQQLLPASAPTRTEAVQALASGKG